MEKGHMVWWVQIYHVPAWSAHHIKKKSGWSDAPSCLVPSVHLGSVALCAQTMKSTAYLNTNDQVFPSMDFLFSPVAQACSKMTVPWFIRLRLWKSGLGSMRPSFHTWIGYHIVQTLTPLRTFGMCWRRLYAAARLSHHQSKIKYLMLLWTEINVVTLHTLVKTMPRWMCHNQSEKWPNKIEACLNFFFGKAAYSNFWTVKNVVKWSRLQNFLG